MKKIASVMIILSLCVMCLSACGNSDVMNGDTYTLSSVSLDGVEIPNDGGSLILGPDGRGRLTLGDDSCEISCDESGIKVNDIMAPVVFSDGSVVITMGDTGLVYTFGADTDGSAHGGSGEEQQTGDNSWTGRLYFSSCSGNWEEYDGNSIAVSGSFSPDADGNGIIELYAPAYSDTVPVFRALVSASDESIRISDALAFHYMLNDGGVTAASGTMLSSEFNNTEFIDPHEYDWYVEPEGEPEPDPEVEYMSLEGDCRDDSGSFIFRILIKQG